MSGNTSRRYPPELKERAVRMVAEIRDQHDSEWAAMNQVSQLLGIGSAETVRKWVAAGRDRCRRPAGDDHRGVGGGEAAAPGERGAEAGQRHPQGGVGFLCGRARPATAVIVAFIRDHQGHRDGGGLRWGVESICGVLTEHGCAIAPSTYYEHLLQDPDGHPAARRATRGRDRPGAPGQLRRLRGPEGVAAAEPGRHRRWPAAPSSG